MILRTPYRTRGKDEEGLRRFDIGLFLPVGADHNPNSCQALASRSGKAGSEESDAFSILTVGETLGFVYRG